MKVLFKQKQWIAVQAIFVVLGIITGIIFKETIKGPAGGLLASLHFISHTQDYTIPILFILFSDLAFNVEYIQGTFLTYLTCGESRGKWMFKKTTSFYIFILIQLVITLIVLTLTIGLITGYFGFQGIDKTEIFGLQTAEVVKATFEMVTFFIIRLLAFVSFGLFLTTLLPGKLLIGSIISIGIISIGMKLSGPIIQLLESNNKAIKNIFQIIRMEDQSIAWAWIFGISMILIFTWLSIENIKRVEIISKGV